MNDDLSSFSGEARLFPLPNLVMFPHVVQPLHIFEPRYRQMTADTLAGDQLLAITLLKPGWEEEYQRQPALFPIACLGRVIADKQLPDGRYSLLLRGLSRVRIQEELATDKPYRSARVDLLPDVSELSLEEAREARARLGELVLARFSGPESEKTQIREMLEG